jgi:uncharacterized protein (DUF1697 family)
MNDTAAMSRFIALIRGINVGSTRKVPMAELRAACAGAGLGKVETYIQSGNLIVDHDNPEAVEFALETLISARFGLDVPVIARSAMAWDALIASCPLPAEAEAEPRKLHLLACKHQPAEIAVEALLARARDDEKVARWGDDIAIYFTNGVGNSRLLPTLIDRLTCTPATARNWNTVLKLREMAAG